MRTAALFRIQLRPLKKGSCMRCGRGQRRHFLPALAPPAPAAAATRPLSPPVVKRVQQAGLSLADALLPG